MTAMTTTPNESALRGLKLLSKQHRKLHPRAQVQTLRRIAVRATGKADWNEELAARYASSDSDYEVGYASSDSDYEVDQDEQRKLRAKAEDAMEACIYLNHAHALGFPVPAPKEG